MLFRESYCEFFYLRTPSVYLVTQSFKEENEFISLDSDSSILLSAYKHVAIDKVLVGFFDFYSNCLRFHIYAFMPREGHDPPTSELKAPCSAKLS